MKPLYQEIADEITLKIDSGEFKEGAMLPAEIALADTYNVSRVTLRKAMEILVKNNKVHRISGKGTFVGSPKMSAGSTEGNFIGVILCNFSPSYGMELLKSLEKHISEQGYSMVFKNSYYVRETETAAIRSLVDSGVKGIIIQPVHNEEFNSELMKLSLTGFPFVLVDRNLPGLSLPFVGTDNAKAVESATKFVFERGHKDVCMFTPIPEMTSTIEERISSFERAYIAKFGSIGGRHVFSNLSSPLVNNPGDELIAHDIKNIENYLRSNPQITCVFASEYAVSRMVRTAARRIGLEIPKDLSLITFDNHNDAFRAKVTSFIRQDEEGIAAKAVSIMAGLIDGHEIKGKFYMDSSIINNDSVRAIPDNFIQAKEKN